MNQKLIKNGFILAALMNFSVLIFSRGFTNVAINEADPVVMSNFGLLMIIMWGLAYLSVATVSSNIKWIAGAFALEKLIYGVVWVKWLTENSLEAVYSADIFAGIFYSIYGLNDFLFMIFFAWVFFSYGVKATDNH
ncbi:hypothetical protein [Alkalimarinus coralli]|uniref:hypothetical protein n=1 Tax=Alkalimarinus coralli TaxID=2935863 RepID=UPI00202B41AB|nr:hypothetical protein [Alkalimarinus coralli]